jgi:hypothetical protein
LNNSILLKLVNLAIIKPVTKRVRCAAWSMAMLSSLGALQYVVAIINAKKKDTFLGLKLGVAQVYKKILFPSRDVDLA